jgi:hypothetical protein
MFFGPPRSGLLVKDMDPDPSIIKQKYKENVEKEKH